MSVLFENYEQQYSVLTADITAQIGRLNNPETVNKSELTSDIERHVEEVQELLEQMDLEIRDIDPSKRQWCRSKLDCYRTELKRLMSEMKTPYKSGYESVEEYSDVRLGEQQKQRLLDNSERIERSGKKLEEGYRIILETQNIGNAVLQDLDHQRETIQRSRGRLRETNEELGASSRILSMMMMRSIQQRVVLMLVSLCLVVAVGVGVYFSVTKS